MGVTKEILASGKPSWRARSWDKNQKKMISLGSYPTKKQAKEVYEARKALEHSGASEAAKAKVNMVDPVTKQGIELPPAPGIYDPAFDVNHPIADKIKRKPFAQRLKEFFGIG